MKQTTLQHRPDHKLYTEIKKLFLARGARMHNNHRGPKIYTELQRVALLVLYVRSKLSLRSFCTVYLPESKWPQWLGLRELPSKSSLHSWLKNYDMSWLRQLNKQLLSDEDVLIAAIDGTGLDADNKTAHYAQRIRSTLVKGPKLDILIDTDTLLVHDWSLLLKPRHDAYVAKNLLSRTPQRGVLVLGDKGYDSEELYAICAHNNNRLWTPLRNAPRSNHPPKKLGVHKRSSHKIGCEQQGRRSLVESVMRSIKNRIRALRARLHYMKKRELAWHVIVRNLELQISLLLRALRTLKITGN